MKSEVAADGDDELAIPGLREQFSAPVEIVAERLFDQQVSTGGGRRAGDLDMVRGRIGDDDCLRTGCERRGQIVVLVVGPDVVGELQLSVARAVGIDPLHPGVAEVAEVSLANRSEPAQKHVIELHRELSGGAHHARSAGLRFAADDDMCVAESDTVEAAERRGVRHPERDRAVDERCDPALEARLAAGNKR